jgi:hypothetical protein
MPSGLGNSSMDPKEGKILEKDKPRGFLLLEDSETELDGGHRVEKENYFLFHKILN